MHVVASHLAGPGRFAHLWASAPSLVVDVRPRPAARPLLPGRYWHVSRNALVRTLWAARPMGDLAQVSRRRLLVVDVAAQARHDVATLLKAHITDFTVLRGGGRNYRAVLRLGTY